MTCPCGHLLRYLSYAQAVKCDGCGLGLTYAEWKAQFHGKTLLEAFHAKYDAAKEKDA